MQLSPRSGDRQTKSLLIYIFILVVFFVCVAACGTMIVLLISELNHHNLNVQTKYEALNETVFPAITICLLNAFPASLLASDSTLQHNISNSSESTSNVVLWYVNSQSDIIRYQYGISLSDLVSSCTMNGIECEIDENKTRIWDAYYGACYTLVNQRSVLLKLTDPILRLTLRQWATEIPSFAVEKGFAVKVHNVHNYPMMRDAITIRTGTFVRIHARKTESYIEDYTTNMCEESKMIDALPMHRQAYSQEMCKQIKQQNDYTSTCYCYHPLLVRFGVDEEEYPPCQNIKSDISDCIDLVATQNRDLDDDQWNGCKPACEFDDYESTVSYSTLVNVDDVENMATIEVTANQHFKQIILHRQVITISTMVTTLFCVIVSWIVIFIFFYMFVKKCFLKKDRAEALLPRPSIDRATTTTFGGRSQRHSLIHPIHFID